MEALRVVGQPVSRKDGRDIVTGNVVYGVDMSLAGMLHGRVVRSAVASGKVIRVDVGGAKALPGVKSVITAADVPMTRFGYGIKDEQIFASAKIRYAREPIAAVAAVEEETAEEAARLVEVEYEETPGVFDVLEAVKEGAPPNPALHGKEVEIDAFYLNPSLSQGLQVVVAVAGNRQFQLGHGQPPKIV